MKFLNITAVAIAASMLAACGPNERDFNSGGYGQPHGDAPQQNYPQQNYPQQSVEHGSSVLPAVLGAAAGAAAGYYLGKKSNHPTPSVVPPHDGIRPVTPPADIPKQQVQKPSIPTYQTPGAITPKVTYSNNVTAPKPATPAPTPSYAPKPSFSAPSKSFSSPSYSTPSYSFKRK